MEKDWVASEGFLDYFYVLNSSYQTKKIVDVFESFSWNIKYYETGTFVATLPLIENLIADIRIDDYVSIRESDEYMIVETISTITDVEEGDKLQIEGRTLSSILDRRIAWKAFRKLTDNKEPDPNYNFQTGIRELLEENIISPEDPKRRIPGFIFKESDDPYIKSTTAPFNIDIGTNLYEVIASMCSEKQIGFRVLPYGSGGFQFELYRGKDRSWSQTANPIVIFSDGYENLGASEYVQSKKEYVSNALVIGSRYRAEVFRKNERTGLQRRETYITVQGDKTEEELVQLAKEEMSKQTITEMFSGTVEPYRQFLFGRDYVVGDIVQVQNKYGFEGRCRILDVLLTRDASGPELNPSFAVINKNNEEVSS